MRRRRSSNWAASAPHEEAVDFFRNYCGPTALAMLLSVSRKKAAEMLLPIAGSRKGSVNRLKWKQFLHGVGGKELDVSRPEAEVEAKWKERVARYHEKMREWEDGKRLTCPRYPNSRKHQHYTVAAFLREHPSGWIVLGIRGHTLVACNGVVVGDTMRSRSMRGRVEYAIHFTEERVIQLRKEEEAIR